MGGMLFNNAIGWALYQLRGGHKAVLKFGLIGFFGVGALILLTLRGDPRHNDEVLEFWSWALMMAQIGILLLLGNGGIGNAVKRDNTTLMIESHRLMPVDAVHAVLGYAFGSLSVTLTLAVVTFTLGLFVSAAAGVALSYWLLANLQVLAYAVCLWIMAVFAAMVLQGGMGISIAFLLFFAITTLNDAGPGGAWPFPALNVLVLPIFEQPPFKVMSIGLAWDVQMAYSLLAFGVMASFSFIAAARKFQRQDQVAFVPLLGVCIVLGWNLLSLQGIQPNNTPTNAEFYWTERLGVGIIGTLASSMLLAMLPISTTVWLGCEWRRRRRLNDPSLRGASVSLKWMVPALTAIVMMLPMGIALTNSQASRIAGTVFLATAVIIVLFLATIARLYEVPYRVRGKAGFVIVIFLLVSWGLPLLIKIFRTTTPGEMSEHTMTVRSACRTMSAHYHLWMDIRQVNWPAVMIGLGVQAGITVVLYAVSMPRKAVAAAG